MLDNNTAPLNKKHSSPRRGVRSGSDGYPRATLNSVGPNYSLFDDFNYEEPSPDRQLRYTRPTVGNTPPNTNHPASTSLDTFPYYQPNASHNSLTKSPFHGSLWNPETQGNSVLRSFCVLTNAVLGIGLISQAYAASRIGWLFFLFLHIVVAWAADYTHRLMTDLAESTGVESYEDLVDGLYGTIGAAVVSMIVLIQNVGSMLMYVMLFTQTAPHVAAWIFKGDSTVTSNSMYDPSCTTTRAAFASIGVLLFVVPFSFVRRIGKLGITSGIVVMAAIYMTFAIVNTYYVQNALCPPDNTTVLSTTTSTTTSSRSFSSSSSSSPSPSSSSCNVQLPNVILNESSFISFPIIMYSYMSHTTILPIQHEMAGIKRVGVKKRNSTLVIRLTILLSFVMYAIVGVFGSMTYNQTTLKMNVIENYQQSTTTTNPSTNTNLNEKTGLPMHFLLLCWSIVMGLSVPSLIYPTKRTLMLSLIPILRGRRVGSGGPPPSWMTNALVSLVLSLFIGGK